MSVSTIPQVAYGLSQPLLSVSSPPIVSPRDPTTADKAPIGTVWINSANNNIFIITAITDNDAFWQTVSGGTGVVLTLDADSGSATPSAGIINLLGGSNINTSAFGSTLLVNLDDSIALPDSNASQTQGVISFGGLPSIQNYGTNNFFLGGNAGNFTLITANAMNNTVTGTLALNAISTGANNSSYGYQNLTGLMSGSANTSFGTQGLISLTSGSYNISLGYQAASNYTSFESSNIIIGNGGSNGESNTIRIGNQGSGAQQQNTCYIAGIYGTSLTGSSVVVTSSGQLGVGSGGGSGIQILDADTGSATGSTVTIAGGSNINTSATGAILTVNLDNTVSISGSMTAGTGFTATTGDVSIVAGNLDLPVTTSSSAGVINVGGTSFIHSYPALVNFNTFVGQSSGNFTLTGASAKWLTAVGGRTHLVVTTAEQSCAFGYDVQSSMTSGSQNSAFGYASQSNLLTGSFNSSFGFESLGNLTTGTGNCAVGDFALSLITTGSENIALGGDAGNSYQSSESNNISIGNSGVLGESNVIRIGTTGSGSQQQNKCFIAGINSVNVGSVTTVVSISGDQLGETTLTPGSGISITGGAGTITIAATGGSGIGTIAGDSGTATGSTVTFNANSNAGSTIKFVASSSTVNLDVSDASSNTMLGSSAGNGSISGIGNTGFGTLALHALSSGFFNTALGDGALASSTTATASTAVGANALNAYTGSGGDHTAVGQGALNNLTTGTKCIAIGQLAGTSYSSSESSNIVIGNTGTAAESNVMRIGTTGSSTGQQNKCFIAGISTVNVGSVATVVSISGDQLGQTTITAGTGISVTTGANSITIAASGTTTLTYTNVNTSPYVVLSTDEYISVDCSAGAITLQFPNAATSGRSYVVKDRTGSAATHNITVTTVGGSVNIDGATTFVMNTNFQSIQLMGNGSSYEIY